MKYSSYRCWLPNSLADFTILMQQHVTKIKNRGIVVYPATDFGTENGSGGVRATVPVPQRAIDLAAAAAAYCQQQGGEMI